MSGSSFPPPCKGGDGGGSRASVTQQVPARPQATRQHEPTPDPSLTQGGEQAAWHATVLTLFPEMVPGPLAHSLAGRALERGLWSLEVRDIRGFGDGRHRQVDDTPFGGGAGMVMRPDVLDRAIGPGRCPAADLPVAARGAAEPGPRPCPGRRPGRALLCGRYEGVDQRVLDARGVEEVSIGDYVLSGGELPALVLLDACVRLLPGVMGASDSGDGGKLQRRAAGIPALHTAGRMAGPRGAARAAVRQPRRDRRLAAGPGAGDHAGTQAGPVALARGAAPADMDSAAAAP